MLAVACSVVSFCVFEVYAASHKALLETVWATLGSAGGMCPSKGVGELMGLASATSAGRVGTIIIGERAEEVGPIGRRYVQGIPHSKSLFRGVVLYS